MASVTQQLGDKARQLEGQGADSLRLELLECARRFKRSWIDMAAGLRKVRESQSFDAWGYRDLYAYCDQELMLKRRTVDKLIGSYAALEQHAPTLLADNRGGQAVPSVDAVDYFARVVSRASDDDGTVERAPEVIEQLREAVFDQTRPVQTLRRQFNPIVFSKTSAEAEREAMRRARTACKRLTELLPTIEDVAGARVEQLVRELDWLGGELERLGGDEDEAARAAS
jgi:hypothetical protein